MPRTTSSISVKDARTLRGRARRLGSILASLAIVTLVVTLGPTQAAEAAPVSAPQVVKLQAYNNKVDDVIDELRTSFVLKVPHGYVDEKTGALQSIGGKYLRIGYDYNGRTSSSASYRSVQYLNTMSASGATRWASNRDEYYTVHKVITAGDNDYLVISVEGDLNIPDRGAANNTVGGSSGSMNLYFSLASSTAASTTSTAWIPSAQTVYPLDLRSYYGGARADYVAGPIVQLQFDGTYNLWSRGQANWGQVLDYGLNGTAPGVLPSNSMPVDVTNYAYQGSTSGPAGSVSDSFWYAWVHEDGSLVTSINTAPIHVTGVTPHNSPTSAAYVVKNTAPGAPSAPTLAYTPESAAQGLTTNVKSDGRIDFSTAGGTGYYRLVVWPESRNPTTVTANHRAPVLSYSASDLFTGDQPVPGRLDQSWTAGSVYYKYDIVRPEAPIITSPADGDHLSTKTSVTFTGTGTPGNTITLKLANAATIVDPNATTLTTLTDGDMQCTPSTTCLVVDSTGAWSYTYTPTAPLTDGTYTVVANQTEQTSGYYLTSNPSNPNDASQPTDWGVTFTIDTTSPAALVFPCLASPSEDATPTLSGTSVEPEASVRVYQDGVLLGDATVSGTTWSYTVSPEVPDGKYAFTARQVDRAGNESPLSSPPCIYQVATDVSIIGLKAVAEVSNGNPDLATADATNWEIIATDAKASTVISGAAQFALDRGVKYTIAERLRTSTPSAANAQLYTPRGALVCTDGDDQSLDDAIFDQRAGTILLAVDSVVVEPISCTVTNQTSHVTYVTKRIGESTEAPAAGWALNATSDSGSVSLDDVHSSAEARSGSYSATVAVPSGLSLVGLQRLNLTDTACAASANSPGAAAERCWEEAAATDLQIVQGQHNVFRAVAASPSDMPALPVTGGVGTLIFTIGGITLLALSVAGWISHRRRRSSFEPHV